MVSRVIRRCFRLPERKWLKVENCVATVAKLATAIDPEVKSWIDNVIVPAMVEEFLEKSKLGCDKVIRFKEPMLECCKSRASAEGAK
jgi:hypothetical protein